MLHFSPRFMSGYDVLSSLTSYDADRAIARRLLYVSEDDYNNSTEEEDEEEEEKNCTSPGENTLF